MNKRFLKGLLVTVAFFQGGFVTRAAEEKGAPVANTQEAAVQSEAPDAQKTGEAGKPVKIKKQRYHDGADLMEKVVRISRMGETPCKLSEEEKKKEIMRLIRHVIKKTLATDNALIAKREAFFQNQGNLSLARGEFLPDLSVEGGVGAERNRHDERTILESVNPHVNGPWSPGNVRGETVSAAIKLHQNLFNGGASLRKVQQARLGNKVSYEDYRIAEGQELYKRLEVLFLVIHDIMLLNQRKADIAIYEEILKTEIVKMQVGEIDRAEVASNQSNLEKSRAKYEATLMKFEEHKGDLLRWTGLTPEDVIPYFPIFLKFLPKTLKDAERIAEVENPILRKDHYTALMKKAEIRIKSASWSPRFDLTASAGASTKHKHSKARQNNSGNWRDNTCVEDSGTDLSVGLSFSMPLDIKGNIRTAVGGAHHDYQATVAMGNKEHSDVMSAIGTNWENLIRAKAQVEAWERHVQACFVVLQGCLQELAVGAKVYTQVLKAQKDYMDAQEEVLRARLQYTLLVLNTLQYVGRLDAKTFGVTDFSDPLVRAAYPELDETVCKKCGKTCKCKKSTVSQLVGDRADASAQKGSVGAVPVAVVEEVTPAETVPVTPTQTTPAPKKATPKTLEALDGDRPSFNKDVSKPIVEGPKGHRSRSARAVKA